MHSGKGGYVILLVISLLITSSLCGQAGRIYKYQFNGNLLKGNVIVNNQGLTINYFATELNIEGISNSSGVFYKISIPGHNSTSDTGKPELPVLSRLIEIPQGSSVNIRISDVKTKRITPKVNNFKGVLFPRQPGTTKDQQRENRGFVIDKNEYSRRGILKSDTVKVELIGKMRNRQLASVQIFPARYDPYLNELELIVSMKVELTFVPSKNSITPVTKGGSLLFNQSIGKGVLNYNPSDVINGYSDRPVKMIIVADPIFKKYLIPFITWKTQKGFRITTIYKGSGTSTYTQLKDTLTKIYNSATADDPAPEYLLLVGDVNRIPRSEGTNNISDLYWGEFDGGGDYIPEMYIGRLPVADTTELKSVLKKIVSYEKFEFADTNRFYNRALVTAGNEYDKADIMNGQVKYISTNYLTDANKITGYKFYYPQSYSADDSIKKLINKGLGFINYTGHGDVSGWLDPSLRSSDVPAFRNLNMYPFVISNACNTAQFNTAGSFGNNMMVAADRGAIGYIGCSNESFWEEDFYWSVGVGSPSADPKYTQTGLGALDRLFHTHSESPSEWYISMGQVNFAGNLAVSESTTRYKKYYWETYTLLGDPSILPYIGTPDTFNISIPDTLPNGITSLSMTIPPNAYMAVSHFDTLWDASYASPSGTVNLEMPGLSNDSCMIVISGQNKVPLIKTVRFAESTHEFINLNSSSVSDATGNGNGLADYGESVNISITISNLGLETATGLYGKLTSASQWVTITSDSVLIGTLSGKSRITLSTAFRIKIADLIPDKGFITFNLLLKDSKGSKNYTIDLCVHAPVLDIINCLIDDSTQGNSNYLAEPGETFNLLFKVTNSGSSEIAGTFSIVNQQWGVTIPVPSINTGPLLPGSITNIPISVKLASSLPKGGFFEIMSDLDCSSYYKNKTFTIPVGKTFESFEYQKMTVFPWQNSASYPWIISGEQSVDGEFSARSGPVPNEAESLLKMSINLPVKDTIRFAVKVSSEYNYDFLSFRLNGGTMFKISGESDWTEKKYLLKEGFNTLEWSYKKDQSVSSGADCAWLDNIRFPSLSFNSIDLKTGKLINPQPAKSYTQETISAQVINLGIDTLMSFNMAYQVNTKIPVSQNFNKKINPGDTLVVTFSQTADLSGNNPYFIKVFGFNNNDNFLNNDTTIVNLSFTGTETPGEDPKNTIKVFPNPFRQSFTMEYDSKVGEEINISIISLTGKTLWEENRTLLPGLNLIQVDPGRLSSGAYSLRISGKTIFRAARIIKIE
jgi:hypothetical protein